MSNMSVKVSVLMSVYNGENFIKDAIESVLSQTLDSWELLITDDCSSDKTKDIIKSYNDNRIVLIQNDCRRGLTENLYRMKLVANGKYLARLDADDVCLNNRFEKQVKYLESHPSVSVVCSFATIIGDGSGLVKTPVDIDELRCRLLFFNPIVHSSIMMHNNETFYDISYKKSQDYELWDRVIASGRMIGTIPEPLVLFRRHTAQISNVSSGEQAYFSGEVRKRALERLNIRLSEQELKTYCNFLNTREIERQEDALLILNVLTSIVDQNKKLKFYNNKTLEKELMYVFSDLSIQIINKKMSISTKNMFFLVRKARLFNLVKRFIARRVIR